MVYVYDNCLVLRIHDGDTITCDIDMGMSLTRHNMALRFAGINAPELTTQEGKDARAYLMTLVAVDDVVRIESLGWDKYNRLDARVFAKDDTVSLNQHMLDTGHAVPLGPYTP